LADQDRSYAVAHLKKNLAFTEVDGAVTTSPPGPAGRAPPLVGRIETNSTLASNGRTGEANAGR
jgi:hypothetical protein